MNVKHYNILVEEINKIDDYEFIYLLHFSMYNNPMVIYYF